jgi:hypothetical protein
MAEAMEDRRALNALARIERAVARIEAAAAKRARAENAELEALRVAHGRLRERVERAVGDLDDLLAPREENAG